MNKKSQTETVVDLEAALGQAEKTDTAQSWAQFDAACEAYFVRRAALPGLAGRGSPPEGAISDELLHQLTLRAELRPLPSSSRCALLFAIPLILDGEPSSSQLSDAAADAVKNILTDCDVISGAASVSLARELFSAEELLAWSPAEVWATNRAVQDESPVPACGERLEGRAVHGLTLRYILGVATVHKGDIEGVFPELYDGSNQGDEANEGPEANAEDEEPEDFYTMPGLDSLGRNWESLLSELVKAECAVDVQAVCEPDGFYAGLDSGLHTWRYAVGLRGVASVLDEQGLSTAYLRYLLVPITQESGPPAYWHVELCDSARNEAVALIEWHPLPDESSEDCLSAVRRLLDNVGLAPLSLLDEAVNGTLH